MSLLSIIIPAYNEGALIQNTASVVADIMEKHSIDYEIVFVNDGSKDATWDEIQKAHRNNEKVCGVCFSRNFGKEGAVFAGLEYAKGDCCVVMDCGINRFTKGVTRKGDARYKLYEQRRYRLAKKLKNEKDVKVRKQMTAEIKRLREERNNYPARNEMDSSIKRLKYVRYADDFLIGITGNLEDCKTVKEDIKNYLNEALKLELSDEKTLITNAQKPAKFLGYDVFIRRCNDLRKDKYGKTVRAFGHKPVLYLNFETMRKKLFDYKAARIAVVNGKEVWKSIVRTYMLNLDDLEIVSQFNAEIRGFYNYYSIANNSYVINSFYHIMSYSMYKVFANKYKSSVKKILLKYKKNKFFQVAYENSKGKTLYQSFYHDGFKRKKVAGNIYCDTIPRTVSITGGRNSLMERLKLQVCELCGATDKLEMHHVRKLKDLKGKSDWEKKMIARRRKTLAVCSKCHAKIDPDRRIRLN